MENRDEIVKELREIAPHLAGLPKVNLYRAPDGYFEAFGAKMQTLASEAAAPAAAPQLEALLANHKKKQGAETAPAGYFNSFSSNLLQKIRVNEQAEELNAITPVLAGLTKTNYLQAPANYFAGFPALMLKKVQAETTTQAASMPVWLSAINNVVERFTAWLAKPQYSYAFAGSLTMVLLVVMITMKAPQVQPAATSNCTDLACLMDEMKISDADIEGYFSTHTDEFNSTMLDNFSDEQKMQKAVDKKQEVPKSVEDLSDEELNFLL